MANNINLSNHLEYTNHNFNHLDLLKTIDQIFLIFIEFQMLITIYTQMI